MKVPRLLVACICKCAADPICIVQGYAEKFGGLFEVFLGLDQVLYMFEHSLIFCDGLGIGILYEGENWIMFDGGGESIEFFVDDHGTNSLFGPNESVGVSRGCVVFWCWGVWIVWRGVDVVGDIR